MRSVKDPWAATQNRRRKPCHPGFGLRPVLQPILAPFPFLRIDLVTDTNFRIALASSVRAVRAILTKQSIPGGQLAQGPQTINGQILPAVVSVDLLVLDLTQELKCALENEVYVLLRIYRRFK